MPPTSKKTNVRTLFFTLCDRVTFVTRRHVGHEETRRASIIYSFLMIYVISKNVFKAAAYECAWMMMVSMQTRVSHVTCPWQYVTFRVACFGARSKMSVFHFNQKTFLLGCERCERHKSTHRKLGDFPQNVDICPKKINLLPRCHRVYFASAFCTFAVTRKFLDKHPFCEISMIARYSGTKFQTLPLTFFKRQKCFVIRLCHPPTLLRPRFIDFFSLP